MILYVHVTIFILSIRSLKFKKHDGTNIQIQPFHILGLILIYVLFQLMIVTFCFEHIPNSLYLHERYSP